MFLVLSVSTSFHRQRPGSTGRCGYREEITRGLCHFDDDGGWLQLQKHMGSHHGEEAGCRKSSFFQTSINPSGTLLVQKNSP